MKGKTELFDRQITVYDTKLVISNFPVGIYTIYQHMNETNAGSWFYGKTLLVKAESDITGYFGDRLRVDVKQIIVELQPDKSKAVYYYEEIPEVLA